MTVLSTNSWHKVPDVLPHDEWQCKCGKTSASYRLNPAFFDDPVEDAWVSGVAIGDKTGLCQECAIKRVTKKQREIRERVPDMTKYCRRCDEELTAENWSKSFKQYRNYLCRQCHKTGRRVRRQNV